MAPLCNQGVDLPSPFLCYLSLSFIVLNSSLILIQMSTLLGLIGCKHKKIDWTQQRRKNETCIRPHETNLYHTFVQQRVEPIHTTCITQIKTDFYHAYHAK